MAIFKAVVLQGYRRSDGNYNIKIRLYHRKQYRYIPTPWYIPESYIGRAGRIRDPEAQALADDLVERMRRRLFALGAAVETMDIDSLVRAVAVPGESPAAFSLDFIAYTRGFAQWLDDAGRHGTAGIYRAAANRFADYLDRPGVDVSEITASMLGGFVRWLLQRPARGRGQGGRAPGLY
ncbi:MAG: phage integrase SAM-like domain-containing protein, partial [Muribaculaceae bacterium]|nr:phage integrase SAM-like domain-containing protein [Muribaculaceae bacterium]